MTTVLDAFTCFDCWALALALRERYPHLRLAALTGPGASWVHALAYEPTTDLYIDVTGPHTAEDVQAAWDDEPDWDELREIPAYELHGLTRLAPEISTDDGITAAQCHALLRLESAFTYVARTHDRRSPEHLCLIPHGQLGSSGVPHIPTPYLVDVLTRQHLRAASERAGGRQSGVAVAPTGGVLNLLSKSFFVMPLTRVFHTDPS